MRLRFSTIAFKTSLCCLSIWWFTPSWAFTNSGRRPNPQGDSAHRQVMWCRSATPFLGFKHASSSSLATINPLFRRLHHTGTHNVPAPTSTTSLHGSVGTAIDQSHSSLWLAVERLHGSFLSEVLLTSNTFWSILLMLTLVVLLFVWEESIKMAKEAVPPQLTPVVNSMLGEMGGLGFIGLVLSILVIDGPLGHILSEWSSHYLESGEAAVMDMPVAGFEESDDILLETFEFLHTAFFEVGIGYFVVSGWIVERTLQQVQALDQVTRSAVIRRTDNELDGGGGEVVEVVECLATLANALGVDANQLVVETLRTDSHVSEAAPSGSYNLTELSSSPSPSETLWFMSQKDVLAECLVVRERIMQTNRLNPSFKVENYFANILGERLVELVELSPLTWLPLIPVLSQGRSIDMSHHVISASSPNAAASCGYFLGTPIFAVTTTTLALLGAVWGGWNYWKMARIKSMVVPKLILTPNDDSRSAILLPPPMEDPQQLASFNSSPGVFGWIESLFREEPTCPHEQLFGVAGAAGPELYLQSIKFHTWLVTGQIIFWGGQIVARDVSALIQGIDVIEGIGKAELVLPELAWFGGLVALALVQLLAAPRTFLNYNLVTSIEHFIRPELLQESCCEQGILEELNALKLKEA